MQSETSTLFNWVHHFITFIPALLLVGYVACQGGPTPISPCPEVYGFSWEPKEGWHGVISIIPPVTFSAIHIEFRTSLPFFRKNAGTGRIELLGGEAELRRVSQRVWQGERQILHFKVLFPPYKDIPRVTKININGKEFCPNQPEYKDTMGTITLTYTLRSSLKMAEADGSEFLPANQQVVETPGRAPAADRVMPIPQCGRVDKQPLTLIYRAQATTPGQWPWHVAIYRLDGRQKNYVCGGSLIALGAAVTAAHCVTEPRTETVVSPLSLGLLIGKYEIAYVDEKDFQKGQVERVVVHPSYNGSSYRGDVAVVVLKVPERYTALVRPVCLWDPQDSDLGNVVGKLGTVVGWGLDESDNAGRQLMMAKLPVVSREQCIASNPRFYSRYAYDKALCAGFRNGTIPCFGDSGGGMVFPKRLPHNAQVWFLRALVSLGPPMEGTTKCDPYSYDVFTDLAMYLSFLQPFVNA